MKPFFILGILSLCAATYVAGQVEVDTNKNEVPVEHLFFETNTEVYKVVEEMPRFPGCEDLSTRPQKEDCAMRKMLEFTYGNLKTPELARDGGCSGTVVAEFIVEKDGTLSDIKAVRDPGCGWGAEVVRLVGSMPKFIPGKQHGEPVRVRYQLPVKVILE
jgi:protein TonB